MILDSFVLFCSVLFCVARVGTDGNGSIKEKERGCTDIFFVLLLLGCWFAMTLLGFCAIGWIESDSIKAGNPNRLVRATDYLGQVCGVDDAVKDLDKAYYFFTGAVVCINKCPTKVSVTSHVKHHYRHRHHHHHHYRIFMNF